MLSQVLNHIICHDRELPPPPSSNNLIHNVLWLFLANHSSNFIIHPFLSFILFVINSTRHVNIALTVYLPANFGRQIFDKYHMPRFFWQSISMKNNWMKKPWVYFRQSVDIYRWLEWDKVSLGAYFPSGWDLVVCVGGLSGIKCR